MNVKYFAILCAVLILLVIVELIRRQKLAFRFSLTWIIAGICVVLLAVFDGVLHRLSDLAGFTLLSNFIFFLTMIFVIFLSLKQSLYADEQNRKSELLAQSLAVLEHRIKKLEEKKSS